MPNSTFGRSNDGDGRHARREEPSFISPETLVPLAADDTAASRREKTADRIGDYELLGEIARGGMGVVYRARHRTLGREVALKMILQGGADSLAVRRFEQEAKAAAALDHPGIVPLFDFGVHQGQPFFTMPLVSGGSLAARVRQAGPPTTDETLRLMRGIIEVVGHAHERGIVHRDLKPENVLVADGRPRVTDFGLAKLRDGECANLTAPGQMLGTPSSVAPEQVRACGTPVGPPADVYALGGILYFLLTGKPPFTGGSVAEVLLSAVQRPPTPPRQFNPTVPAELEEVCLRCLEKDPARRYGSAEEMGRALGFGLTGSSGTRSMPPLESEAPGWQQPARRGNGLLVASLAVLACCLAAGAAAAFVLLGKANAQPQQASVSPDEPSQPGSSSVSKAEQMQAQAAKVCLTWLGELEKKNGGVEVELVGSEAGVDGVHHFRPGQKLRLRVQSAQAGYVGVWTIAPDGSITQLFPSAEGEEDNHLKAGVPLFIPNEAEDPIVATPGGGRERLLVLRAPKPWDPTRGIKEGPYFVFREPGAADRLKNNLRGLARVPGFTSKVISFEVVAAGQ